MAHAQLDPSNGTARITPAMPLPVGQALRFALFDARAKRYLTATGWTNNRRTLVEVTPSAENEGIFLDAATAELIPPGTTLLLEEIFINLREQFVWPLPAPLPPPPIVVPVSVPAAAPAEIVPETEDLPPLPVPIVQHRGRLWLGIACALALGLATGFGVADALLPPVKPSPQLIAREQAVSSRETNAAAAEAHIASERSDIAAKTAAFEDSLRKAQSATQNEGVQLAGVRSERDSLQAALAATQNELATRSEDLKSQAEENRKLREAAAAAAPSSSGPAQVAPAVAAVVEPAQTEDVAALHTTIETLKAQAMSWQQQFQVSSFDLVSSRNAVAGLSSQVSSLTRDKQGLADNLVGRDHLIANLTTEREDHLAQIQTLQSQLKDAANQLQTAKAVPVNGSKALDALYGALPRCHRMAVLTLS